MFLPDWLQLTYWWPQDRDERSHWLCQEHTCRHPGNTSQVSHMTLWWRHITCCCRCVLIQADTRCQICDSRLLSQGFYMFPCHHAFHKDCLLQEVTTHTISALLSGGNGEGRRHCLPSFKLAFPLWIYISQCHMQCKTVPDSTKLLCFIHVIKFF